jgi:2-polyprenyl-3-methyl-5-hydroxy-6-metoxy-1,4-benzoquinol methylase
MDEPCIVCSNKVFIEKFPNSQELPNWKFKDIQYRYVECTHCKILKSSPIPSPEVLTDFYNTTYNYKSFLQGAFWKKVQAHTRLYELKKLLPKQAKILDFGCGHGYFVRNAGLAGYQSYGFDIGSESFISDTNIHITYNYDFDTYQEQDFDLITAWHVIEHLPNPLEMIEKLRRKLKPNGILAVAVPNSESLGFEYCGEKWGWVQEPLAHIYHYNSLNLAQLIQKTGFGTPKVMTRDTLSSNLFDLLISVLFFKNRPRGSVSFSQSKGKSNFMFHLINVIRAFFITFSLFVPQNKGAELVIITQRNP